MRRMHHKWPLVNDQLTLDGVQRTWLACSRLYEYMIYIVHSVCVCVCFLTAPQLINNIRTIMCMYVSANLRSFSYKHIATTTTVTKERTKTTTTRKTKTPKTRANLLL